MQVFLWLLLNFTSSELRCVVAVSSARLEDSTINFNKAAKGRGHKISAEDSLDEIALTSMNVEDIEELLET